MATNPTEPPSPVTAIQRDDPSRGPAQLAADYEAGPELLRAAVAGMASDELLARPVAGKWSTLEVVCHVSDSEQFFADRLKVQLREQGARHDLVDAVFALQEAGSAEGATGTMSGQDDLVLIVRRVEALGQFLDSEDGRNLLAGAKLERYVQKLHAGSRRVAEAHVLENNSVAEAFEFSGAGEISRFFGLIEISEDFFGRAHGLLEDVVQVRQPLHRFI